MRLRPGERLGAYEIIEWIGVDEASVHYRARAMDGPHAGKAVLIKRLEDSFADDSFLSMFLDEARLGTILQHPNIAQLYEVGRVDGCHFMAFEFVTGEYLYQLTRARPDHKLPVAEALALGAGITAGLHYAHEKATDSGMALQIVHTDISPATVIVAVDGRVKLIDFRSFRVPFPSGGKMRYLSPEQCRGKPLDRRSDLFNLGIVLYEATTGRYPFAGESELDILQSIVRQEIEPPSRRDPSYPRSLERIVMTALERDLDRRYPTARIVGDALAAVGTELGIESSSAVLAELCSATRRA